MTKLKKIKDSELKDLIYELKPIFKELKNYDFNFYGLDWINEGIDFYEYKDDKLTLWKDHLKYYHFINDNDKHLYPIDFQYFFDLDILSLSHFNSQSFDIGIVPLFTHDLVDQPIDFSDYDLKYFNNGYRILGQDISGVMFGFNISEKPYKFFHFQVNSLGEMEWYKSYIDMVIYYFYEAFDFQKEEIPKNTTLYMKIFKFFKVMLSYDMSDYLLPVNIRVYREFLDENENKVVRLDK
jgi:hypothetical protein